MKNLRATGKEIRFSVLVKASGKPETLTLWENPKNDPVLIKAVKENRILTIIQHPAGKGKDFGQIGFQQQPGALYLVFPKKLKADANVRVVGLKYDMPTEAPIASSYAIKEKSIQKEKVSSSKVKLPDKRQVPPPIKPPIEKRFDVVIRRVAVVENKATVTAKNRAEAETKALAEIVKKDFKASPEEVQDKVLSIKESESV